jgi:peptidoglycan glycosyltransferase
VVTPETLVTCPGELVFDGFPVSCSNVEQGVGTYPFSQAYTYSVNAIFADTAVKLGWARLNDTARRFSFDGQVEFVLDTSMSQIRGDASEPTEPLLASTGFGQGELLATPLQMALVAAAVANEGVLMKPLLGLSSGPDGGAAERLEEPNGRRVIDETVAAQMEDMMVSVVDAGQAPGAEIDGVRVAGKTGTAETGVEGQTHAWFISFAPADDPVIAVAVLVEFGGQGSRVAAPIAGEVMREALAQ